MYDYYKRKNFRYKIRPRCLRDVSKTDLSTVVLGIKVSIPVGISPTAMQKMAHPDGECANARGTFTNTREQHYTRIFHK